MVEILINDNISNIKTNDINIFINGDFEITKKGAEAPIINVIANKQI